MNEELKKMDAAIGGYLLSKWLPHGSIRKIIFFIFVVFAISGFLSVPEWWHYLLLFFALTMSPRVIGSLACGLGKVTSFFQASKN